MCQSKKVALLGAAGGIGQSLALLLKLNLPAKSELSLYDISPVTPGIAVDLSHIPTDVKVTGFAGEDPTEALKDADVVVISAGVARKPGMTRADLFNTNATIVHNLVEKAAKVCPKACIAIITNPVNTIIPIAAEVLKKAGVYDKNKLFGVTTLDVIRANTFVAEAKDVNVKYVRVPVIGGHSGTTILPLLSQATVNGLKLEFTQEQIEQLTHRIQNAGTEVVEAKAGGGSATLSMAQAGAEFALGLVRALIGEDVIRYAYVDNANGETSPAFFAYPIRLGTNGVEKVLPIGNLSEFEKDQLEQLIPVLNDEIQLGQTFNKNA
ncbi:TPA: malate dehydrogenase [Mannheimia haemolytica]|uniref:Malate dehydrogenase n=2 Tax=Mannheimia haemolytica TaxID=75985 RepID=A0A248ZZ34_MANHA|nr:malate dehydrogenase [Mannheimia haemolytica]AWW70786.1 malate dehydrogenase [Pasteurellaceae bacterium 12565]AGI31868.1 malate dehydrogenase [Mannheimia haemolytica USDA-ARS-USMARC-183]AGI36026.1 malate dehydrogenase [Mannheimia haemolytica USDA-ARS-USMARC-185]AGK03298.1 malate dehydrogenase Mdh [Mannheimia haemolytica M42548]AGQ25366.1 malate dehydrogenase [Mannheimia haemolytica D153]